MPAEILRNGAYGLLVPTNNVEALFVAMIKELNRGKTEYPFLREWDVDVIAERYRSVANDISRRRLQNRHGDLQRPDQDLEDLSAIHNA